jgi:hypothetical protein
MSIEITGTDLASDVTILISSNLLVVGIEEEGKLVSSKGMSVRATSVEMNFVMVEKDDETTFFELGDRIRWMEVE